MFHIHYEFYYDSELTLYKIEFSTL